MRSSQEKRHARRSKKRSTPKTRRSIIETMEPRQLMAADTDTDVLGLIDHYEQLVLEGHIESDAPPVPETSPTVPTSGAVDILDGLFDLLGKHLDANETRGPRIGTNGPDTLVGSEKNNTLLGRGGSDTLYGGARHDEIYGNKGNDELHDGKGWDETYGGKADDLHVDGPGNDRHHGGPGNDTYRFQLNAQKNVVVDASPEGTIRLKGRVRNDVFNVRIGDDLELRLDRPDYPEHTVRIHEYYSFERKGWKLKTDDGEFSLDREVRTSWLTRANLAFHSYQSPDWTPQGWQIVEHVSGSPNGLQATLFKTGGRDQYELVIRGTEMDPRQSDIVEIAKDVRSLKQAGYLQAKDLIPLVREWIPKYGISQLFIDGHSQGFQVAQWTSLVLGKQFPHVNFDSAGFNGLGIAEYLPPELSGKLPNVAFTNILDAGDFAPPLAGAFAAGTKVHIIDGRDSIDPFNNHRVEFNIIPYLVEHSGCLPAQATHAELTAAFQKMFAKAAGIAGDVARTLDLDLLRLREDSHENLKNHQGAIEQWVEESKPTGPMLRQGRVVQNDELVFDFGTNNSSVAEGATRITKQSVYSPSVGWGISGVEKARDRGRAGHMERDVVLGTDMEFIADVVNGTYDIEVVMGDRDIGHERVALAVNGYVVEEVSTAPGEIITRHVRVHVVDQQLSVRLKDLGGLNRMASLAGLTVRRVDPTETPPLNEEKTNDPMIVILTPGKFRGTIWDRAIDLVDIIPNLIQIGGDIVKGVAQFKAGHWLGVLKEARDLYYHIESLSDELNDLAQVGSPQWMSTIANGLSRQNRLLGNGALDLRLSPVGVDAIRGANGTQLLGEWKGSQHFIVLDNVDFESQPQKTGLAIAKLVEAFIIEQRLANPDYQVDLMFVGHDNGATANRRAIEELDKRDVASSIDFVKAVMLDPVAYHGQNYSWKHPEKVSILDSVVNFYQTKSLALGGSVESTHKWGQPLDGRAGGGWQGFFNGFVRVWSTESGNELARYRHEDPNSDKLKSARLTDVSYSRDGTMIATSGRDNSIQIRLQSSNELLSNIQLNGDVIAIEFTPDGKQMYALNKSGWLRSFDPLTGRQLSAVRQKNAKVFAISNDGRRLATGTKAGRIQMWDVSSGTPTKVNAVKAHKTAIRDLEFDQNGRLASVAQGKVMKTWDVVNRWVRRKGKRRGRVLITKMVESSRYVSRTKIRDLEFAANGQLYMATGRRLLQLERTGRSWRVNREWKDHVKAVNTVSVSADGSRVATGGDDKTAFIYSTQGGEQVKVLNAPMLRPRRIALSPDGERLAIVSFNKKGGPVSDRNVTSLVEKRLGFIDRLFKTTDYHEAVPFVYADHVLSNFNEGFLIFRDSVRAENRFKPVQDPVTQVMSLDAPASGNSIEESAIGAHPSTRSLRSTKIDKPLVFAVESTEPTPTQHVQEDAIPMHVALELDEIIGDLTNG